MAQLQHKGIFRFCAVPQVMAIATLAEIYNNPRVFQGAPPPPSHPPLLALRETRGVIVPAEDSCAPCAGLL